MGISVRRACALHDMSLEFRDGASGSTISTMLPVWIGSWQTRDRTHSKCGWLWTTVTGYPRLPRGIHETIHERSGYLAGYPQPSTISQQRMPTMWMTMCYPYQKPPHALPTTCPPPGSLIHTIIHRKCGDGWGHLEDDTSAYLCTQGASCPHFQACYPRGQ